MIGSKTTETKVNDAETILYADCSEIPLYNWIKIAITGNHKWLVKSGPVSNDLSEHYEFIYAEYQTLVKDTKSSHELTLKINLAQTANRIDIIKVCIHQLRLEKDERLISILHSLGFNRLTYTDLEKDLKLTETYLQSDIIKFQQKKIQYEKMSVEDGGGITGAVEADFYNQISIIEKWKGSAIDVYNYSVIKWVSDLNQLKAEIRNSEK